MATEITDNKLDNISSHENEYIIIIHKLGYVTCYCGYVTSGFHNCKVQRGKLSFDYCYDACCRLCDENFQVTYKSKDGYLHCSECNDKIPSDICELCFCKICDMLKKHCFCCKICANYDGSACICYDSNIESNDDNDNSNGKK